MNPITLSADAWHFRLANYGTRRISSYDLRVGIDICTYLRLVVVGLFVMITRIVLIVLGVAWIGYSVYDLYQLVTAGDELDPPTVVFVATLVAMIGTLIIIGSIEGLKRARERRRYLCERGIEKQPGLIALTYRKFKDKTCFKIQFEDWS